MRENLYAQWLAERITKKPVSDYIARCDRVEHDLHIDLDTEYNKDGGVSLLSKLNYSMDDKRNNRPLRCNIYFKPGVDLRNGMASLKTAVKNYFDFCKEA